MKGSKVTEAQIAFILRQGEEGTSVGEICRKAGISEATYYNWRKKYAGLMPSEMTRLPRTTHVHAIHDGMPIPNCGVTDSIGNRRVGTVKPDAL